MAWKNLKQRGLADSMLIAHGALKDLDTARDLCTQAISPSCGVKNLLKRSFIGINSLMACVFAWPEFTWPESEIFVRAKVSHNLIAWSRLETSYRVYMLQKRVG